PAHDPRHPQTHPPRHDRLHRTTPTRRQDTPRSKPLPQALPRPQPLPPTRTRTSTGDLTDIEASLAQASVLVSHYERRTENTSERGSKSGSAVSRRDCRLNPARSSART